MNCCRKRQRFWGWMLSAAQPAKKEYSESQILLLQKAEHEKAHEIATSINCNLYVHHMLFDETDITSCLSYIERGPKL